MKHENKITKYKNSENLSHLEITEVILVHCNIVNNNHQQGSRVLYTFVSNKSFVQLLDISPPKFIFLKTFSSEFSYIEVWFTDQNSKQLEIENTMSLRLVIKSYIHHKMRCSLVLVKIYLTESRHIIFVKGYGSLSFAKNSGNNICKKSKR